MRERLDKLDGRENSEDVASRAQKRKQQSGGEGSAVAEARKPKPALASAPGFAPSGRRRLLPLFRGSRLFPAFHLRQALLERGH